MWPFTAGKERNCRTPEVSELTRDLRSRTDRLSEVINAQGIETRAVAREAQHIRETNHFGPALVAAISTPRRKT